MINEVILVGKIKEMSKQASKRDLKIEVERPFDEVDGRKYDTFNCRLWSAIFNRVLNVCKCGDLIAIKGRIVEEQEKYIIMAENVVLLNKENK